MKENICSQCADTKSKLSSHYSNKIRKPRLRAEMWQLLSDKYIGLLQLLEQLAPTNGVRR